MSVEKVRKLIELAGSPNMEEARTAAYQACRLIRELGLAVVEPKTVDEVRREAFAEKVPVDVREGPVMRVRTDAVASAATAAGFCTVCFTMYYPGELVLFVEEVGVVHDGCRDRALCMQATARTAENQRRESRERKGRGRR